MSQSIRLPDVMPDVASPTLLVVCDTHHCLFFTVGGHQMVEQQSIRSKEAEFTDGKGMLQSPAAFGKGGMISGADEMNQFEKSRMSQFANEAVRHIDHIIRDQKIKAVHLSAPAKFLSVLRDHLSADIKKYLQDDREGNFVKEQPLKLLLRFRPDLDVAAKELRSQESYSPGNRPPKT